MEEHKEISTKSESNMEQSDKIHKTLGRIGLGGMALSSLVGLMYFWNHSSDDNIKEPVQDAPVAHTEKAQGESTKKAQPQKTAEKTTTEKTAEGTAQQPTTGKATKGTDQKPSTGQAAKPVTEKTSAGTREGASAEKGQTPTAAGQESEQAQPAEEILALPAFKPMKPACSISERNAHAKVKEGLNTVSSFSDTLDTIIVREVSSRLESGLGKGDAFYNACLDIVSNIDKDVKNPPLGCARNRSQLRSDFALPVSIMTQDATTVMNAVCMRSKCLAANLDGHSEEEAIRMLNTFGTFLLNTRMLETAAQAAQKNAMGTVHLHQRVLAETSNSLKDGMGAHEALCNAIRVSAAATQSNTAQAFFVYADINKLMQNKSRTAQISALDTTHEKVSAQKGGWSDWVSEHTGLLLFGGLGALTATWLLGRKKSK